MNPQRVAFLRAIRGPVMMITVGALFALNNFTQAGMFGGIDLRFHRTFPLLIIVVGILSLGKRPPSPAQPKVRYQAQWGPPRPPVPPMPPPTAAPPSPAARQPGAPAAKYRGSTYEGVPGARPRGSETRDTHEKIKVTIDHPADPPGGKQ